MASFCRCLMQCGVKTVGSFKPTFCGIFFQPVKSQNTVGLPSPKMKSNLIKEHGYRYIYNWPLCPFEYSESFNDWLLASANNSIGHLLTKWPMELTNDQLSIQWKIGLISCSSNQKPRLPVMSGWYLTICPTFSVYAAIPAAGSSNKSRYWSIVIISLSSLKTL